MKIAAISDMHLGFKSGTPRYLDAFEQAKEAMETAVMKGADLILICGDIFERSVPSLEVLLKGLHILNLRRRGTSSLKWIGGREPKEGALEGIPIVALHGNHEWRARAQTNILQVLEEMGVLIYLNTDRVLFEAPDGEKVAIYGMSYAPENLARGVLTCWKPSPVSGAWNILLLHQSIGSFVFSTEESSEQRIQLGDLPEGFDLYICGHVHCKGETRIRDKPLLFPGSTERTQLLPAERVKGFYFIDLADEVRYEFVELQSTRDFFFEEIRVNNLGISELEQVITRRVEEVLQRPRKNPNKSPLIKIKLVGSLATGCMVSDFDAQKIVENFADAAIIEIDRTGLSSGYLVEVNEVIRKLREAPLSLREKTLRLLEGYLGESSGFFSVTELYNLLVEEREEVVLERIRQAVARKVRIELG